MSHRFWALTKLSAPSGDYGRIVTHGMSAHRSRVGGRIQLERVGPDIAPVTLPGIGDVIVTSDMRAQIAAQEWVGVGFAPVDKVHVSRLEWSGWDATAEYPGTLPKSGEPEDVVLELPHDPAAADALGDLWELVLERAGRCSRKTVSRQPRRDEFTLDIDPTATFDIFRAENVSHVFVSDRGRQLIESQPVCACAFNDVVLGHVPSTPPPEPPSYIFAVEPIPEGYVVSHEGVDPFSREKILFLKPKA
jgi:hypothetical protein